jgi:GAF domain-containing protein
VRRLIHWASRAAADIDAIGPVWIERLNEAGLLERASDFYALERDTLLGFERIGEISADRMVESIDRSRAVGLRRALIGLAIPMASEGTAARLCRAGFTSLEEIADAGEEALQRVEDIGPKVAASIAAHLNRPEMREEIARLRQQLADARLADELREALRLAATVAVTASPVAHERLLEMIVDTAAHVINARAGALFLIDEAKSELVFEVALGQRAAAVKELRVPLGHGIAGLVAVSGQPMAISDARRDPRQAADIAERVGYLPQSILCVPLIHDEQVVGVLELLDKDDGASFTTADMEVLGLFANQAAVAIEQSRLQRNLGALVGEALRSLGGGADDQGRGLQERLRAFAGQLEEDAGYVEALALAQLVHEIAGQGEAESRACRAILLGFAEYLRARPRLAEEFGQVEQFGAWR